MMCKSDRLTVEPQRQKNGLVIHVDLDLAQGTLTNTLRLFAQSWMQILLPVTISIGICPKVYFTLILFDAEFVANSFY